MNERQICEGAKRRLYPIRLLLSLLAAVMLLVSACGSDDATAEGDSPEVVRFAVTRLEGMEQLQREFGVFKDKFEELVGARMEFFAVSNRTAAVEAMKADRVDLVFTGAAEYVAMQARADVVPLVQMERPGYRGQIRTYAGSGIADLEDLVGQEIDVVRAGAGAGHLAVAQLLADNGIDPNSDVTMSFLGEQGPHALVNNDVVASSRAPKGWQQFFDAVGIADYEEKFPVVAEGPQLPADLIVASGRLPEEFREHLASILVEHADELVEAMVAGEGDDNDKHAGRKFLPASDDDYDYIRQAYRTIGIEDLAEVLE